MQRRELLLLGALLLLVIGATQGPALHIGLFGDDFAHRRFILDHLAGLPSTTAWWNMFDVRGAATLSDPSTLFGRLPWWASSDFSFALLRPLSTASHFLDYLLWPESPWAMRAHNLVLFAVVVALACALYQSILGQGWQVLLAALLFTLDDTNATATVWIASRNTLLTAIFLLATLWSYDVGVRGDRRFLYVAPLLLLFAHASSEGAIAAWAYLLAYACFLDPRAKGVRVRSLLPMAAVSLSFIALSSALGYGVRGSSIYIDPRVDPGLFARAVVERFPGLLETQLAVLPQYSSTLPGVFADISGYASRSYLVFLLATSLWAARRSRAVAFFTMATLLALLPLCATDGFARLLLLTSFAAHGLTVSVFGVLVQVSAGMPRAQRALLLAPLCGALVFIHGWVALELPRRGIFFSIVVDKNVLEAAATLPSGPELQGSTIMVLNYPDYLRSVFVALYRRERFGLGPERMHFLGTTSAPVRVTRTEPSAVHLEPIGGYLLDPSSAAVRRAGERFVPGQLFDLGEARIQVAGVTDDGRPNDVFVRIAQPQERELIWVSWDDALQRFDRIALPEVGHSMWVGPPR